MSTNLMAVIRQHAESLLSVIEEIMDHDQRGLTISLNYDDLATLKNDTLVEMPYIRPSLFSPSPTIPKGMAIVIEDATNEVVRIIHFDKVMR